MTQIKGTQIRRTQTKATQIRETRKFFNDPELHRAIFFSFLAETAISWCWISPSYTFAPVIDVCWITDHTSLAKQKYKMSKCAAICGTILVFALNLPQAKSSHIQHSGFLIGRLVSVLCLPHSLEDHYHCNAWDSVRNRNVRQNQLVQSGHITNVFPNTDGIDVPQDVEGLSFQKEGHKIERIPLGEVVIQNFTEVEQIGQTKCSPHQSCFCRLLFVTTILTTFVTTVVSATGPLTSSYYTWPRKMQCHNWLKDHRINA